MRISSVCGLWGLWASRALGLVGLLAAAAAAEVGLHRGRKVVSWDRGLEMAPAVLTLLVEGLVIGKVAVVFVVVGAVEVEIAVESAMVGESPSGKLCS